MGAKDKVLEMKAAAEAEVSKFDGIVADMEAEEAAAAKKLAEEKEISFQEGLKKNGEINSDDTIYTEADLKAKMDPLSAQITALEQKVAQQNEQIVGFEGSLAQAKEQGASEMKAALRAKYDEQQVAESAGETGFKDLLY